MKRARFLAWALIPLLVGIPGCDVAVGVYFATRKSSSHSSAALAPAIDTTFSVWVANLSAGTNSDSQVKTNIQNNGGQPTALLAVLRQQTRGGPAPATTRGSGPAAREMTPAEPRGMPVR